MLNRSEKIETFYLSTKIIKKNLQTTVEKAISFFEKNYTRKQKVSE
jgi:hypothetical protein